MMSDEQMRQVINAVRGALQHNTCCAVHACQVALSVTAGFTLDIAADNPIEAARIFKEFFDETLKDLESGKICIGGRAATTVN